MLQSGTLTAEDMRWLWGPRNAIIGSNSLIWRAAWLLRGRTVAENIALLALSNFAERGVGSQ